MYVILMIHQSHSRKDLLEISDIFEIKVHDKLSLSKKELGDRLWLSLQLMKEVKSDEEYYFISTKQELIRYLQNPHQLKSLTIEEKQEIIKFSRQIIYYCENDYVYYPNFSDMDELKKIAMYISNFGDISTVRRALSLLRYDKKIQPCIEPVISKKMSYEIEKEAELRLKRNTSLKVRRGGVVVEFD